MSTSRVIHRGSACPALRGSWISPAHEWSKFAIVRGDVKVGWINQCTLCGETVEVRVTPAPIPASSTATGE